MAKFKYYIKSLRLRTLPLSISGIIIGLSLAYHTGYFNIWISILCITTTLFLQILSNVSNEYGDSLNGVDNENRIGPQRSLQSGNLSINNLREMIILFILLSATSGTLLIFNSFSTIFHWKSIAMLSLGVLAIIAAIKYTVGKNCYGYKGFGDIAVFLFFGWVSTGGAYYLTTQTLHLHLFLPASAIGLFSVGVLNINNIRDRENDKVCGKNTLAVKIGKSKAKIYHMLLISGAWLLLLLYSILYAETNQVWFYLPVAPLFMIHLKCVFQVSEHNLDKQLRNLSLMTLLVAVLFGVSQII